jgi:hypothetical protein
MCRSSFHFMFTIDTMMFGSHICVHAGHEQELGEEIVASASEMHRLKLPT